MFVKVPATAVGGSVVAVVGGLGLELGFACKPELAHVVPCWELVKEGAAVDVDTVVFVRLLL